MNKLLILLLLLSSCYVSTTWGREPEYREFFDITLTGPRTWYAPQHGWAYRVGVCVGPSVGRRWPSDYHVKQWGYVDHREMLVIYSDFNVTPWPIECQIVQSYPAVEDPTTRAPWY
jgi:hypothetical protein